MALAEQSARLALDLLRLLEQRLAAHLRVRHSPGRLVAGYHVDVHRHRRGVLNEVG